MEATSRRLSVGKPNRTASGKRPEPCDRRSADRAYPKNRGASPIRGGLIELSPGRRLALTERFGGLLAGRATPETELAPLRRLRVVLDGAEVLK